MAQESETGGPGDGRTGVVEAAGSFALGRRRVHRVGYGAMQLAGDNVCGPPRDRGEALQVLRTEVDSGINHIGTAQFYGPGVVNELIREALHPYPSDLALVSKVAASRDDTAAVLRYDAGPAAHRHRGEPRHPRQRACWACARTRIGGAAQTGGPAGAWR